VTEQPYFHAVTSINYPCCCSMFIIPYTVNQLFRREKNSKWSQEPQFLWVFW